MCQKKLFFALFNKLNYNASPEYETSSPSKLSPGRVFCIHKHNVVRSSSSFDDTYQLKDPYHIETFSSESVTSDQTPSSSHPPSESKCPDNIISGCRDTRRYDIPPRVIHANESESDATAAKLKENTKTHCRVIATGYQLTYRCIKDRDSRQRWAMTRAVNYTRDRTLKILH